MRLLLTSAGITNSSIRTALLELLGKPIAEVARDLGIVEGTLGNWVNTWRRENAKPEPDLSPMERVRVKEMEDEIRRLRMENEFLKKAAAFFARTQP